MINVIRVCPYTYASMACPVTDVLVTKVISENTLEYLLFIGKTISHPYNMRNTYEQQQKRMSSHFIESLLPLCAFLHQFYFSVALSAEHTKQKNSATLNRPTRKKCPTKWPIDILCCLQHRDGKQRTKKKRA